ncbi:hypothetical protein ABPG77_000502 [Micractinium sp. CCAP 211/92]
MAGGGGELEASLLETPTFVLSVVFFVFLALSFSFELGVHFTQNFFIRRGRHGMANAVQKIVMELTLLGFVSLLLTAFSNPLGRMCVSWSDTMADWTLESNILGCPCCLAKTQGVSLCTQMDHECLWNVTSRKPYCDCTETGREGYATDGYDGYAPGSQLHEECRPYKLSEAQFFVDVSVASLRTIADALNISITDVCAALADGTRLEAEEGSIDPSLLGDPQSWEDMIDESGYRRRRLLGTSTWAQPKGRALLGGGSTPGPSAGGGCGGRRVGNRRLLSGGGGGGGDGGINPLLILLAQDPDAITQRHLLPRISLFKCTGPFMSSSCPDGQVPLISENALHQMHIYLFLVAIFHVAVSVVQILLGRVRLRIWRRWEWQAQQAGTGAVLPPAPPLGRVLSSASRRSSKGLSHAENGAAGILGDSAHDDSRAPADGVGSDTEAAAATAAAAANEQAGSSRAGSTVRPWALLRRQWGRVQQRWQVRHARMPSAWHCLAEAGICFVQALSPDTVTKQNFLLMRAAWLASQPTGPANKAKQGAQAKADELKDAQKGLEAEDGAMEALQSSQEQLPIDSKAAGDDAGGAVSESVDSGCSGRCSAVVSRCFPLRQAGGKAEFVDHMLDSLEDDLPSFVGLSIEMGVVACVMLLLAGLTGWIGPLFLIVASALLLITNMTLVALLRNSCRGGQPHSSSGKPPKWWRNPHLLLAIPIRLILFLCSFVYSSLVLFAWQFGSNSCFFSTHGDIWGVGGLPWWTGIIWVAVMLLWVGLVTIPTFSLVVHPRRLKRAPHVALGHDPSGSLHAGHEGHPHNISMLLDAAMSNGSRSSGAAPKVAGPHVQGSQQAAASNGASALGGAGGSGGSSNQQATPGLDEDLLAEISRLRARVAQLEALQSSCAANGQGAASKAATLPASGSRDASESDQP